MSESSLSFRAAGSLYVIAAPSGAGKTSLVRALIDSTPGLRVSVSHTTRAPRPGEVEGKHYHFVDHPTFLSMRERDLFLESAQVFDNFYGTSRDWVLGELRQGTDVILEIDWQGARQVRERMPGCVGIFILPPSRDALLQRLQARAQDNEEVIARRMRDARREIAHYAEFDYLVVNDDFEHALGQLQAIIAAQRLTKAVQCVKLSPLLAELLS